MLGQTDVCVITEIRVCVCVPHLAVRQVSLQQADLLSQLLQLLLVVVQLLALLPLVSVSLLLQALDNALLHKHTTKTQLTHNVRQKNALQPARKCENIILLHCFFPLTNSDGPH